MDNGQVTNKSWTSHEQVVNLLNISYRLCQNKSWTSDEQVIYKYWTSCKQVMDKSWTSHEQLEFDTKGQVLFLIVIPCAGSTTINLSKSHIMLCYENSYYWKISQHRLDFVPHFFSGQGSPTLGKRGDRTRAVIFQSQIFAIFGK